MVWWWKVTVETRCLASRFSWGLLAEDMSFAAAAASRALVCTGGMKSLAHLSTCAVWERVGVGVGVGAQVWL